MATNPTLLSMELCKDADKNTIPATDAGTSGLFSEQYGWQNINSLPLSAGGIAPNRRDFNGAFNLLGGIAFYAQKGFTFNFDSSQDYFAGCVVIDATDGKRYECIADVAAGGSVPSADTTHWKTFGEIDVSGKANITLDNLATYHRDVITTSGTYTAPATALYKVTIKGGGGGGGGSQSNDSTGTKWGGGGGGAGGTTLAIVKMSAGDTAAVVIGAGGAGGAAASIGQNGGDSTVTIAGNTYTAGGGAGAGTLSQQNAYYYAGDGGAGTIRGEAGSVGYSMFGGTGKAVGGSGGGAGGGVSTTSAGMAGTDGGGGAGATGLGTTSTSYAGGAGGNGFVQFEYFA
jgi:hypothetical protein